MASSQPAAWRSPHDRVSIKDLLAHYQKPMQELREKFQSAFAAHPKADPQVLDDIFILRYLLSKKGDVAASADSIQKTLDWRRNNLSLIQAATDLTNPSALSHEKLQRLNCYMAAGIHTPTSHGDLVLIIRAACVNFDELAKDLDSLAIYVMYLWEVCFQYCDTESRKRGYFVKLFVVKDMHGFSPNPMVMQKFGAVMDSQSKRSEFLYPQFLGMMCAANPPEVTNVFFKMISPLMSKDFLEKFPRDAFSSQLKRFLFQIDPAGNIDAKDLDLMVPSNDDNTATLATFVQARYLQRQREKAAKVQNDVTSTVPQPVSTAPVEATYPNLPNLLSSVSRNEPVTKPRKIIEWPEADVPVKLRKGAFYRL